MPHAIDIRYRTPRRHFGPSPTRPAPPDADMATAFDPGPAMELVLPPVEASVTSGDFAPPAPDPCRAALAAIVAEWERVCQTGDPLCVLRTLLDAGRRALTGSATAAEAREQAESLARNYTPGERQAVPDSIADDFDPGDDGM